MCCGSNRAAARAAGTAAETTAAASIAPSPATATSVIVFEYVGNAATSIRGPVSGQVYRFGRAGDRVRVDPRDRPGVAAMPLMRWVR